MTAASPLLLSLRACIVLCKKKSSRPRFTALSFKITIANHGLRFRTSNLIVDPKCSHDTRKSPPGNRGRFSYKHSFNLSLPQITFFQAASPVSFPTKRRSLVSIFCLSASLTWTQLSSVLISHVDSVTCAHLIMTEYRVP